VSRINDLNKSLKEANRVQGGVAASNKNFDELMDSIKGLYSVEDLNSLHEYLDNSGARLYHSGAMLYHSLSSSQLRKALAGELGSCDVHVFSRKPISQVVHILLKDLEDVPLLMTMKGLRGLVVKWRLENGV